MKGPPIPISELRQRIYKAISSMESEEALSLLAQLSADMPSWLKAHWEMEHSQPSPSRLMRCRYQQWLSYKETPPDQEIPVYWKISAAMGVISEPFWFAVLQMAGLGVELPKEILPIGNMIAHPDLIAPDFVVELKRQTGWGYKYLTENPAGIVAEEPGHLAQCQLEAAAAKTEYCLYLSVPADAALLQSLMRQRKSYGPSWNLEPVYLEWVQPHAHQVAALLERAEMLAKDFEGDEPPPREFDGVEFKPNGSRKWPCGWCEWLSTCQKTYGIGEQERPEAEVIFE